jgi:hypothetical protein
MYLRYTKTPGSKTMVLLWDGSKETLLGTDQGTRTYTGEMHFDISNGWAAYEIDNGSGIYQLYLRTPTGKIIKATSYPNSVGSIARVGPNGEVWFYYNRGLYCSEKGASPKRIANIGIPHYIGKVWHLAIGRSLFAVKLSGPWPDAGITPPDRGPPDYGPGDIGASDKILHDAGYDANTLVDMGSKDKRSIDNMPADTKTDYDRIQDLADYSIKDRTNADQGKNLDDQGCNGGCVIGDRKNEQRQHLLLFIFLFMMFKKSYKRSLKCKRK